MITQTLPRSSNLATSSITVLRTGQGHKSADAPDAGFWRRPLLVDRLADRSATRVTRRTHNLCLKARLVLVLHDHTARLLDLEGGTCHALDAMGTRMLLVTLEQGPAQMARALAGECDVPEAQVLLDWNSLVAELHRSRLVEPISLIATAPNLPSDIGVWLRLALAWLSFRTLGWSRTLRIWRLRSRSSSACGEVTEATVAAIDELVRRHAGKHPLNPQCKERALVSWRLLRDRGCAARLVMGIELYPFSAHAWTEYGDRIVGDTCERCARYTPVAIYQ